MVKRLLSRIYKAIPPPLVAWGLRLLHPRFSISVVGVFFAADGTVLVLRHVFRHSYPWGLPSGFLSAGETPENGVLRELKEETGFEARTERIVSATPIAARHLEIVILGLIDRAQTPRLSGEIFEVAFCDPANLPAAMPPAQRALVVKVASLRAAP